MRPYIPGEQPQGTGWIKLNTNEYPYPPAPGVLKSVAALVGDPEHGPEAARKYPDPHCSLLRQALARRLGRHLSVDQILVGNGSDEILRLLFHAFANTSSVTSGSTIAVLNPTYSLYDTLAAMFGAHIEAHQALEDSGIHLPESFVQSEAAIAVLANPNPPLGTLYPEAQMRRLLEARAGRLTVIDEAYVDFAGGPTALDLLSEYQNLAVSRTLSKGGALAGFRVGYTVASNWVVSMLDRIRDSYNINALSQVAALAAVESADYYEALALRIIQTRERVASELRGLGFRVAPSAGNFLFARHGDASTLLDGLRARKILVRYFPRPGLADGLRISIGTEPQMEQLLQGLRDLLSP
jgi:histidinol-phosphate aminotransferase